MSTTNSSGWPLPHERLNEINEDVRRLTATDFTAMGVHRPMTKRDIEETCPQAALDKTLERGIENVVKLVAPRPPSPVDSEVVAELEDLLERAKAGRFNGIAYVTVTSENVGQYSALGTAWAGDGVRQNAHTAIGGIEVLKERAMRALFEWEEDRPLPGDLA